MSTEEDPKLSPEDQERVDRYLASGYNRVARKPFRPFLLLAVLAVVVTFFTVLSIAITRIAGVS